MWARLQHRRSGCADFNANRKASYRHGHHHKHRATTKVFRLVFHETAQPGSNLFKRSCRRHQFPVSAGYEYEQWWYVGHVGGSRAQLFDQGAFLRAEFGF